MNWEDKLEANLDLNVTGQDFGIINADGKKLSLFLDYFENNEAIDPWEWEELLDLILESANDAIKAQYITYEELDRIRSMLLTHKEKFPIQLDYWSHFDNSEGCYPVVDFVNEIIKSEGHR